MSCEVTALSESLAASYRAIYKNLYYQEKYKDMVSLLYVSEDGFSG
jgi:hypothetical protein